MVTSSQGGKKSGGGFRSLFKRKKDVPVETKVGTNVAMKESTFTSEPRATPLVPIPAPVTKSPTPVPPPPVTPPVPTITIEKAAKKSEKTSWFSRTQYFKQMSNWAFDVVDLDGSGCVDEKELYSGLLLIHLKLGSYAGPAACRPVAREQVHDIFVKRDRDNSGSLDREEFGEVMAVLCGNVFSRVFAQWSLTLIIVPMVAKLLLDGIVRFIILFSQFIANLEDYDSIEDVLLSRCYEIGDWVSNTTPDFLLNAGTTLFMKTQAVLDMVPDSVWSTIPVTLVSCILGGLAVPYIIFKIDDYFQSMAEKSTKKSNSGPRK